MNVWIILVFIFVSLLDLSNLHELENELFNVLKEMNSKIAVNKNVDSVNSNAEAFGEMKKQKQKIVDSDEVFVNFLNSLDKRNTSPTPTISNLINSNENCKFVESQQDIFNLTKKVLHTTFPKTVRDAYKKVTNVNLTSDTSPVPHIGDE